MQNCIILIFLSIFLSSCAIQKNPAPIVYNHTKSYSKNKQRVKDIPVLTNDNNKKMIERRVVVTDEIIEPVENDIDDNEDYIIPGKAQIEDTDYNNSLNNHETNITESKKIIYHEVQKGESIEDISIMYQQSVEDITSLNKLSSPYQIQPFQSLKILVDNDFRKKDDSVQKAETPRHENIQSNPEFIKPVDGTIIANFGSNTSYGKNNGINIAADIGTKVVASATGTVIYSDYDATFGNLVMIKLDGKNIITAYAHLEDLIVKKTSHVKQGDIIGYVGASGKVDASQLHFAIRDGKNSVDPQKFISFSK